MPLPLTVVPIPARAPRTSSSPRTAGSGPARPTGRSTSTTRPATRPRPSRQPAAALGLELLPDGRILVCDAHRGLLALDPATGTSRPCSPRSTVNACSSPTTPRSPPTAPSGSPTRAGSGPSRSGRATSSSTPAPGRLFRRAPDGRVDTVLDGLCFANGVALTAEADAVLVAETGTRTIRRVQLDADGRPGATTTWVDDLPGHPDNIALGSDGLVWVTVASPTDRALRILQRSPRAVRGLVRRAPERLKPTPKRTARVLALDSTGRTVHDLDFDATTGTSRPVCASTAAGCGSGASWSPPSPSATCRRADHCRVLSWSSGHHLGTGVRSLAAPARRPPATSRRAPRATPRASRRGATGGTRCRPPARRPPR